MTCQLYLNCGLQQKLMTPDVWYLSELAQKLTLLTCVWEVKGKAIPLQAWTVPEGSRWLRLPDFKTVGT
jgi:hypothetical protein